MKEGRERKEGRGRKEGKKVKGKCSGLVPILFFHRNKGNKALIRSELKEKEGRKVKEGR